MPSQNIRSKCHITDQNTVCLFVTCTGRSISFRFGGFNCCLLPCWPRLWLAKGWILPSAAFQKELEEPSPSQGAAMEAEASDWFGICPAWVQDLPSYWLHLKVVFYSNWVFVLIESYLGSFHWLPAHQSDRISYLHKYLVVPLWSFELFTYIWVQQRLRECRNWVCVLPYCFFVCLLAVSWKHQCARYLYGFFICCHLNMQPHQCRCLNNL